MPFTAVIFDFFATLTPSTPEHVWAEHTARSAAPLGLDPSDWRQALDDSWAERATGVLGDLPATFRELARRHGAEPGERALAAACAARRAAQHELFRFRPDALAVLEQVRARGFRLGVLSDCTIELADAWQRLPVAALVDARVLSCEQGRRKPDPVLFTTIARELGVAPADCLYVGDGGGGELSGASACGMHAVMLRADDWHTSVAHSREDDWAGPWVRTLSAVLSVLDGRQADHGASAADGGTG
ncbi:MAG TPA: HAD-IA family hydrolase [Streptosporangiaceae bacterium]|nr:HAD-IA family hydrolase [Streptosporangiaceae bacterium]